MLIFHIIVLIYSPIGNASENPGLLAPYIHFLQIKFFNEKQSSFFDFLLQVIHTLPTEQ